MSSVAVVSFLVVDCVVPQVLFSIPVKCPEKNTSLEIEKTGTRASEFCLPSLALCWSWSPDVGLCG